MAKPLLPDELWVLIQPLIPPHPPQPEGGRPFLDDRKVLNGDHLHPQDRLCPGRSLPQEMGCGCGMTCWNCLRDWQAAGVLDLTPRIVEENPPSLRTGIHFERFIVDTEPCPRRRRG